jgi:hypothetical protein
VSSLDAHLGEIALRKERLKMHADAQRRALNESIRELDGPAGVVDRALEVARFVRAHPAWVAAGVAGLLAVRRRSVLSLAGSLLSAWRLWSTVSAWTGGRS